MKPLLFIISLLCPFCLCAQDKTGVWLLSTYQYDGENLIVCDTHYTRIRIYNNDGEMAHAELTKDEDGSFTVTPREYAVQPTYDGFILTSPTSAQMRSGICSESWRRIDNTPASLVDYIMMQCRAIYTVPEEIQTLLRANFLSEDDRVFMISEEEPEFPGGDAALQRFLLDHLRYPQDGLDRHMKGSVLVRCIVEKDGHISSAQAQRSTFDREDIEPELRAAIIRQFENEALRLVYLLPAWTPARQRSRPVRHQQHIRVPFLLSKK